MKIITTAAGGICVIRFEGDFLSELDHETFREKIRALTEEGQVHVAIDLSGVKYINSCGLGSLVCALSALRTVGGDVRLVNVGEHVAKLLEITQLNRIFAIYPSLEMALQEFHA